MKTLTLAGYSWNAHSPSCLTIDGSDRCIAIAFDSVSWLIGIGPTPQDVIYGDREFRTRDEAARLVAHAINTAEENLA